MNVKLTSIELWYDVMKPFRSASLIGKSCPCSSGRGFTLIEVMISMVVLLVVSTSVFAAVPATLGFGSESQIRMQATGAAQDYLDVVRQYIKTNGVASDLPPAPIIPIQTGASPIADIARPSMGNFVESANCTARSFLSFDCVVTVTWHETGTVRSEQVESYIVSQAGF